MTIKCWPIFALVDAKVNKISLTYEENTYMAKIYRFFREYRVKFFDINVVTLYKARNEVQD